MTSTIDVWKTVPGEPGLKNRIIQWAVSTDPTDPHEPQVRHRFRQVLSNCVTPRQNVVGLNPEFGQHLRREVQLLINSAAPPETLALHVRAITVALRAFITSVNIVNTNCWRDPTDGLHGFGGSCRLLGEQSANGWFFTLVDKNQTEIRSLWFCYDQTVRMLLGHPRQEPSQGCLQDVLRWVERTVELLDRDMSMQEQQSVDEILLYLGILQSLAQVMEAEANAVILGSVCEHDTILLFTGGTP